MIAIHFLLIVLHTITGIISFIAGWLITKQLRGGWLFNVYLASLLAMTATLVATLIWDWSFFLDSTRIMYILLSIGAIYSVFRAFSAKQREFHRYTGWRLEFIEDIGITMIAIVTILLVVSAIDLFNLPIWMAILMGAAGVGAGYKWLQYTKQDYIEVRGRKKEY